jgi:uncharacterized protein HemX
MNTEALVIVTLILLTVLGLGLVYLVVSSLKRSKNTDTQRLERLGSELMEKLDSTSLSEEQKTKIAEALEEIQESRAQSSRGV